MNTNNTENKSTLPFEWWNDLYINVKTYLYEKYKIKFGKDFPLDASPADVKNIYQSEHASLPLDVVKEEGVVDDLLEGFLITCLDVLDKGNLTIRHNSQAANDFKSVARYNKQLHSKVKVLLEDGAKLADENAALKEVLELITTSPEWIKKYGGGEVDKKAKTALNQ